MSRLTDLIDDYKDSHGQPSDASIARFLEVPPQTLHTWRTRQLKQVPNTDALRRLAALIRADYVNVVLKAALLDAGLATEADYANQSSPAVDDDRRGVGCA